ncbi:MAG: amidohydrolase family protein, partial [Pirellulales bacterium]
ALAGCADLADRLKTGVNIHVAEDPIDEQLTRERYHGRILDRFGLNGLMEGQHIFAHGTHLSEEDIARINEARGIVIAHNPRSNMNNGVGYAPVREFENVMLGTDGIGADMWNEARTAVFKGNDAGRPLPYSRPLQMLQKSARLVSSFLGVKVGVLEPGSAADLVLTDYRQATPLTTENLAGHFLYAMGPEYVRHVMIAGRWCLKDREVITCDEAVIRGRSVEVARELHERMVDIS